MSNTHTRRPIQNLCMALAGKQSFYTMCKPSTVPTIIKGLHPSDGGSTWSIADFKRLWNVFPSITKKNKIATILAVTKDACLRVPMSKSPARAKAIFDHLETRINV